MGNAAPRRDEVLPDLEMGRIREEEQNQQHHANHHDHADLAIDETSNDSNNSALNRPTINGSLAYIPMHGRGTEGGGEEDEDAARARELEEQRRALAFELDGVQWGGKGQQRRSFPRAFTEAMRSVELSGAEKLIIMQRYVRLVSHYHKLTRRWEMFCYASRSIVAVGSVAVPVLVAIDGEIREHGSLSQALAYTTMVVGFAVTLVNGFQELFQSTKQFITSSNTEQALTAEGWAFVSLSGKYSKYDNHNECWQRFFERTQKMNAGAHNVHMTIARSGDDSGDERGKNKPVTGVGGPGIDPLQQMASFDDDDGFSGSPIVYANH